MCVCVCVCVCVRARVCDLTARALNLIVRRTCDLHHKFCDVIAHYSCVAFFGSALHGVELGEDRAEQMFGFGGVANLKVCMLASKGAHAVPEQEIRIKWQCLRAQMLSQRRQH